MMWSGAGRGLLPVTFLGMGHSPGRWCRPACVKGPRLGTRPEGLWTFPWDSAACVSQHTRWVGPCLGSGTQRWSRSPVPTEGRCPLVSLCGLGAGRPSHRLKDEGPSSRGREQAPSVPRNTSCPLLTSGCLLFMATVSRENSPSPGSGGAAGQQLGGGT